MKKFMNIDKKMKKVALFAVGGMLISACSMHDNYQNISMETPAQRLDQKLQLSKTEIRKTWPVTIQSEPIVQAMAMDYSKRGSGDVHVMVTYATHEYGDIENKNRDQAAGFANTIRQSFATHGIDNVNVRVAPVPAQKSGLAVVAYDALIVQLPDECRGQSLMDVKGHISRVQDYHFGCDNKNLIAKMVSNKKDLLGKTKMDPASSAYLGTAMESYRAGETVGADELDVTTSQLSSAGE